MLNRLAYVMLAATSMAPVLVVYGFLQLSMGHIGWAIGSLATAATLVLVCKALLDRGDPTQVSIAKPKRMDKNILAFLVTWALPIISRGDRPRDALAPLAL